MGFLDLMYVCGKCKKAVKIGFTAGVCPDCGAVPIGFGKNIPGTTKLVSDWKKMSDADKEKFVNDVLAIPEASNEQTAVIVPEYERFITTTNNFQNRNIVEYFGLLSGTDIYLVGGLLGGGLANQEKLMDAALRTAKSNIYKKATAIGANAIIGASVNITSPGNTNHIIVSITGTAVKLEDVE